MKTITVKAEEINFESKLTLQASESGAISFAWHGMNLRLDNRHFENFERLIAARYNQIESGQTVALHRAWQIGFVYFPKEETK